MNFPILSVNTAPARVIGALHGESVLSGIAKKPVAGAAVFVRALGIDGDEQADLTVHGGADKAVYAYPADHWAWWESEHRLSCGPATFGENLTVKGCDESDVAIGDRFGWGDAILEISQPRVPCFKLAMHTRPDVPRLLALSARCGWYLRVMREGSAPTTGATLNRLSRSGGPSVREAFVAAFDPRASSQSRIRVYQADALSHAWKTAMGRKIPDSAQ
jgi:MOSC domain-containing protein YiiM